MKEFDKTKFNQVNNVSNARYDFSSIDAFDDKYWVKYNGQMFLYKKDSSVKMFNELVVCAVCKLAGIDCVNVYPASTNTDYGVIVETFVDDKTKAHFPLTSFVKKYDKDFVNNNYLCVYYTAQEFEKALQNAKKDYIIDSKLLDKFKTMVLLDFLFVQDDRNIGNVEFLVKEVAGHKFLTMAPIFDNENVLGHDHQLSNDWVIDARNETTIQLISMANRQDSYDREYLVKNEGFYLAKELSNNENLKQVFNKLCEIDFSNVLQKVAKIYPKQVDKDRIDFMKNLFEKRKFYVELMLNEVKNNQEAEYNKHPLKPKTSSSEILSNLKQKLEQNL